MASTDPSLNVQQLWELKRRIEAGDCPGLSFVHFNMLLREPAYRQSILNQVRISGSGKAKVLAESLLAIDDGRVLYHSEAGSKQPPSRNPESAPDKTRPEASEQTSGFGFRRNIRWIAPVVALALVLIGFAAITQSGPQVVEGSITANTTWASGDTYRLKGLVFVEKGATLTIEPGVRVEGEHGSALIVTREGQLMARGQRTRPIVFTSSQPQGQRLAGDWGGLVLLGDAPVNRASARIEGIPSNDPRGAFGGQNPEGSCGILEYVRIEFAGYEVFANNELNGLTLGGCGRGSIVRHVQVHRGTDDGVEVFGGTVDLKYILITGAHDDGLDWDMGWQGRTQYLIVQQHAGTGDNAFEGDNSKKNPDAEPRSMPTIYNATLVGPGHGQGATRAMTLRRGTGAKMHNFIIDSFQLGVLDTRGRVAPLAAAGTLELRNAIIAQTGPLGGEAQSETGEDDNDFGFDEKAFLKDPTRDNLIRINSALGPASHSMTSPQFIPVLTGMQLEAPKPPKGEFWDESARFHGAVMPGASPWYEGWSDYPEK